MIQRFSRLLPVAGKVQRMFWKRAWPEGERCSFFVASLIIDVSSGPPTFPDICGQVSWDVTTCYLRRSCEFPFGVLPRLFTAYLGCLSIWGSRGSTPTFEGTCHREYCESLCPESAHLLLSDHYRKIGQDYYRQTVGIPQGSVLSTILCSFFYGDLETKVFKFTEDMESVS